jgi:hypothetical protein
MVNALAKVTNADQSRIEQPDGHIDWSSDWSLLPDGVNLKIVTVEHGNDLPFTLLSLVDIELNGKATARHLELANAGFEPFARQLAISTVTESPLCDDFFAYIDSAKPVTIERGLRDPAGFEFVLGAECRRLGADTGKDIVVNLGRQLRGIGRHALTTLEQAPNPQSAAKLAAIMKKYRP